MSETGNLKLKKHDNPETNTEKFDIDNYLNGNWDKIDENVGEVNTNISNINSKNTELEKELKEAQEDFYQNSIRGQASGEYIHVEDSSNCRANLQISGNSEQETRSGKNLLKLMEGTYSNNGITAVVKDGVITLNGTATAISFVGINLLKSIELTNDKAYHLSAFNERTVGDGTNYCSLRINQDNIQVLFNTANVNGSITTNLKISYITIRTAQGITYNNFVVKPQLELGAGTNEWEQGGVSPSPDYQSPVKTVGSNVNILIPKKYNNQTINGVTLNSNVDGSITLNGTMEEAGTIGIVDTTFSISKDSYGFSIGETKLNSFNIFIQKTDYTNIMLLEIGRTTAQVIKELDAMSIKSVNMYINKGTVFNNYVIKPKLEKKRVTTYSPYSMGSVKVTKCNKNLFDKNTTIDGKLISSSGSIQAEPAGMCSDYIQIKTSANYYISGRTSLSSIALYDKNKTFLERISTTQPNGVLNITNSNCKYIIINALLTNKDTLQIEEKTATAYEEHQEQSYIMPVQQEMLEGDYFDWDNEEEVHTWNKLVLDGTENWEYDSTYNYFKCPSYVFEQIPSTASGDGGKQLSNYFSVVGDWNTFKNNTNLNGFNPVSNLGYKLIIRNTNCRTIDTFKAWLKSQYDAGTPVTIYYKLATPTRLPFTDEQKAVAKELNNARTYKNVTNITTDSIAIIDLDYAKDLETLLTSKESEV